MNKKQSLAKEMMMSSGYWVLNKKLVKELGIEAAFLLSSFSEIDSISNNDGWFYQTIATVEKITSLSRYKQEQAIKLLSEKGLLDTVSKGMPRKRYFKINYDAVANLFANIDKLVCDSVATSKEHNNKELNKDIKSMSSSEEDNEQVGQEKSAKVSKYSKIFDYWSKKAATSKALVNHKQITKSMKKAIDKAYREEKDIDVLIKLIDRFVDYFEYRNKTTPDMKMKKRGIPDFFGQKAYDSVELICMQYHDEGSIWRTHGDKLKAKQVIQVADTSMERRTDY